VAKTGRRNGRRNKGCIYQSRRGFGDRMVPLVDADGCPLLDRQLEEAVLKEAYTR